MSDNAHQNIVFFQKFKPYTSNYEYEKTSLFANIFCIMILIFFIYYFFYKIRNNKNKSS